MKKEGILTVSDSLCKRPVWKVLLRVPVVFHSDSDS